jgi:hypothetical protein
VSGRRLAIGVACAALFGGCNLNEPSYYPANAAVEIGGMVAPGTMVDPFATVELPFRPPRPEEAEDLRAESATRGFAVPWLRSDAVNVSVLYTIKNLGDRPATAHLEVDGASEFASYDVVALRAAAEMAAINNEDEIVILPLITTTPIILDPGQQVSGTLREDDFDEAALDLDALSRFGATPAEVLINSSKKSNVGLAMLPPNHIRPALYRVRVGLIGSGHLRLEVVVRVRDEASQLLLTGGDPFAPAPMPYTPPMMMPSP